MDIYWEGDLHLPVVLYIYNDFTEVRRTLKIQYDKLKKDSYTFKFVFTEEQFRHIDADSIELECKVQYYHIITKKNDISNKQNLLQKKDLYCTEPDLFIMDKNVIIQGSNLLVQDVQTKRYYYDLKEGNELKENPKIITFNIVEVQFVLSTANHQYTNDQTLKIVFKYRSTDIKWTLKHDLDIDKNLKHHISSTAVIDNMSTCKYNVENAKLFLELSGDSSNAGLNSFMLEPESKIYVEFMHPLIDFEEISALDLTNPRLNTAQSMYNIISIKCKNFLPAGPISVRFDGYIACKGYLHNLKVDEAGEILIDLDNESTFIRKATLTSQNKKIMIYSVKLYIINNHCGKRKFRYDEVFPDFSVNYSHFQYMPKHGIKTVPLHYVYSTANGIRLLIDIEPKSYKEIRYRMERFN
ncbi:hypothetical protein GJ496_006924 [Pomphorhynchus laevis]|nr:hypothetical protein GJ496_006924 [Pomphorhynchus laevis]